MCAPAAFSFTLTLHQPLSPGDYLPLSAAVINGALWRVQESSDEQLTTTRANKTNESERGTERGRDWDTCAGTAACRTTTIHMPISAAAAAVTVAVSVAVVVAATAVH